MNTCTVLNKPVVRQRISVISSRALGEMLDPLLETYTFERLTGAVEHRAWDGTLLAISLNGKNYIDRKSTAVPSPVKLVQ